MFDLLMMFASCFNIFGNAYYSAFGVPASTYNIILDMLIETLFLFDMCFCFCQEYMDEETYNVVSGLKQIAKHYFKKSFIFDFIAWFPFGSLIGYGDPSYEKTERLFRVFRLLRLPRLAQLVDTENFKSIVYSFYNDKLNTAVLEND